MMKTYKLSEIQSRPSLLGGVNILHKMKQGRDNLIRQTFVSVEVGSGESGDSAIKSAIDRLNNELDSNNVHASKKQ